MWRAETSPLVAVRDEAPPCLDVPAITRCFASLQPPGIGVHGFAGHGFGQHARQGPPEKSYLGAPPGLHRAAEEPVRTENWLAGHGPGHSVPQGFYTESYMGVPAGLHQVSDKHVSMENWPAGHGSGHGFGQSVRQQPHAQSYFAAPPGMRRASEEGERAGNMLAGHCFGKRVQHCLCAESYIGAPPGLHRHRLCAESYIGAPPGLHQAAQEHEMMENWLARHGYGQDVRKGSRAGSHIGAPPGLRHPSEELKENCFTDPGSVPVTTLLVHNVHRRLTQEDVLRLLPCDHFGYDLLYVLFDLSKRRSSGRMFVNFTTPRHAAEFQAQWHGQQDLVLSATDERGERKPLRVEPAWRQGLELNVANWQKCLRQDAPVSTFPALFIGGNRIYFWEYRTSSPRMQ